MAKKKKQAESKPSVQQKNARTEVDADVLGSYTGMGKNGDAPVQDADDL